MTERFFNNAGPVDCQQHYCIPPLERFDLSEIERLIDQQRYFVLHAPRQTGKTSSMLALMRYLNARGRYICSYVNVEIAQSAREDVARAMRAILSQLGSQAGYHLDDPWLSEAWGSILETNGPEAALTETLTRAALHYEHPLVLLIDEIDTLIGDTLVSVLRQIRTGYHNRPAAFPQSIVLCGVRDVRDYRIHAGRSKDIITGGSAFNIKAKSLRMGGFSHDQTLALLAQHTRETGQVFTPEAQERVWHYTEGQPWLVNAFGYGLTFELPAYRDRTRTIDEEAVETVKEQMILARVTHLEQLTDKLDEDRVRRVIEPILAGDAEPERLPLDDVQYCEDLGLITTRGQLRIANALYREIIPRELTYTTSLTISEQPAWYILPNGCLDLTKLLTAFQAFFREHSEHWIERFDYKEAGPQLLMQAFLQRVVNGGGRIEREYGLGRMRTDLLVIWPHPGGVQKAVIELKLLHKSLERTLADGLEQTWNYADRCDAGEAHLLIFDRGNRPWEEKVFQRKEVYRGRQFAVWGM